jgi:D-alanine-D-alanine ligase
VLVSLLYDSPALYDAPRPEDRFWLDASLTQLEQLEAAVQSLGHATARVAYAGDVGAAVSLLDDPRPDLVFNLTQGGHCANLARVLDLQRLRYTGAGPLAIDLTTDKALTHDVLRANGIPVPHYQVVTAPIQRLQNGLRFPVIAKLQRSDGSYGLDADCVLWHEEQLAAKLDHLFGLYREPVILESFVDGRELSVSLLGNGDSLEVLPIREIDFSSVPDGVPRIMTYDSKWTVASDAYQKILSLCPADLEPAAADELGRLARRVCGLLGCRDYARIDFRLDATGRAHVVDVNTNPDLEEEVGFVVAANQSGRSFADTVRDVMATALSR